MKVIFDKIPLLTGPRTSSLEVFPVARFLQVIRTVAMLSSATPVVILRLGGIGEEVWKYESQLDAGMNLTMEFQGIEDLAARPEAVIDVLHCQIDSLQFGVSDSTFMFIQCGDRELETAVASQFEDVQEIPDYQP